MKEFAGLPCLGYTMHEVESSHLLVCNLGIYPDDLGMIERWNEAEVMPCGGHVNVSARFVGFGFKRKLVAVASLDVVFAEIIYRFAQTLHGFVSTAARVSFNAFPAAPQDENFGAKFRAQIHGAHRLVDSICAYSRIIGGKGSIAKDRMEEERDGSHGHDDPMLFASLLEFANNSVALGRRGVNRDEIVVMEID